MNSLRVLVVTCAHRGDDARIVQRQISAMLDAGFEVTLIAPEPLQTQVQQHDHPPRDWSPTCLIVV